MVVSATTVSATVPTATSPALNTTDTCIGVFDKGEINRDIFHNFYGLRTREDNMIC